MATEEADTEEVDMEAEGTIMATEAMATTSKRKKKKDKKEDTYNYGNSVGHFGDYSYNKSTIDKYRDKDAKN